MKNIVITLFLVTPVCFADWGDVYYCQMTSVSQTSDEGNITNYKLEKFKFKLDKEKQAMVFGEDGFFKNDEMDVHPVERVINKDHWTFTPRRGLGAYHAGKFLFSRIFAEITTITATCDKF